MSRPTGSSGNATWAAAPPSGSAHGRPPAQQLAKLESLAGTPAGGNIAQRGSGEAHADALGVAGPSTGCCSVTGSGGVIGVVVRLLDEQALFDDLPAAVLGKLAGVIEPVEVAHGHLRSDRRAPVPLHDL